MRLDGRTSRRVLSECLRVRSVVRREVPVDVLKECRHGAHVRQRAADGGKTGREIPQGLPCLGPNIAAHKSSLCVLSNDTSQKHHVADPDDLAVAASGNRDAWRVHDLLHVETPFLGGCL